MMLFFRRSSPFSRRRGSAWGFLVKFLFLIVVLWGTFLFFKRQPYRLVRKDGIFYGQSNRRDVSQEAILKEKDCCGTYLACKLFRWTTGV